MHSTISPSFLPIVVNCAGSLALSRPYFNRPETPEAAEGTGAHWLAAEYAEGRKHGLGTVTPNAVTVDADMIHGANIWVATVEPNGLAEIPIQIQRIHPECWGTPDRWRFIITGPRSGILKLWDYKYGHKYVDPWENWQCIGYAIGLIDLLVIQGYDPAQIRVEVCIVQPRSYHKNGPVQYWRHPTGRLFWATEFDEYADRARAQVAAALQPFAPTHVGGHCKYCPGRIDCKTLQLAAADAVEYLGTAQPLSMSPMAMDVELAILDSVSDILKARKTALTEQLEYYARAGNSLANHRLEPGQANRKWTKPDEQVIAEFAAMGVNVAKPAAAITPTQTIDRHSIDPAVMDLYSGRPNAALKLKRISSNEAKKVFGT